MNKNIQNIIDQFIGPEEIVNFMDYSRVVYTQILKDKSLIGPLTSTGFIAYSEGIRKHHTECDCYKTHHASLKQALEMNYDLPAEESRIVKQYIHFVGRFLLDELKDVNKHVCTFDIYPNKYCEYNVQDPSIKSTLGILKTTNAYLLSLKSKFDALTKNERYAFMSFLGEIHENLNDAPGIDHYSVEF